VECRRRCVAHNDLDSSVAKPYHDDAVPASGTENDAAPALTP
jgi:hypothetical protein